MRTRDHENKSAVDATPDARKMAMAAIDPLGSAFEPRLPAG
jgi:hypothetical protein